MIRLNLIEAAGRVNASGASAAVIELGTPAVSAKKKNRALSVVVAALIVIVCCGAYLMLIGVPKPLERKIPPVVLSVLGVEDPASSGLSMDRTSAQKTSAGGSIEKQRAEVAEEVARAGMSPERVVTEIRPEALIAPPKKDDYASFLPMEKIAYQKALSAQMLAFINTVTPSDINFSDIVYSAPDFYYMHAEAGNPSSQKSYLDRLRAASMEFRTPPIPENAPATEITAYGRLSAKPQMPSAPAPLVKEAEVAAELGALHGLEAMHKLRLAGWDRPAVEDRGVYRRFTYKVSTNADFPAVQAFVDALQKSPVRVGIEKLEMHAAAKGMTSQFTFTMYVAR